MHKPVLQTTLETRCFATRKTTRPSAMPSDALPTSLLPLKETLNTLTSCNAAASALLHLHRGVIFARNCAFAPVQICCLRRRISEKATSNKCRQSKCAANDGEYDSSVQTGIIAALILHFTTNGGSTGRRTTLLTNPNHTPLDGSVFNVWIHRAARHCASAHKIPLPLNHKTCSNCETIPCTARDICDVLAGRRADLNGVSP
mmetsp:Transcript_12673/g.28112  ORF Transcript_12673/g.28112 Transcript_12673/m.28112 type:complete len:202 (-) Transcript_12673:539-1144(-)